MIINSLPAVDTNFSKEEIYQQLEKIFVDPVFVRSNILRNFLSFIVDQTLMGRSNCLKEYTIAVHVLNKPSTFKPKENSIVRIHAARLRRALSNYYQERGALHSVYISVPVGSYVPVFMQNENRTMTDVKGCDKIEINRSYKIEIDKSAVVAVIPFQHLQNNQIEKSLSDGLGIQLSTALMEFGKFSVIAYCTMRNLSEKISDIEKIASFVGAKYIVTGYIQSHENCFRIHIQMIHAYTKQQLWGRMYEEKFVSQNIFDLQDEIVKCFISDLNESQRQIEKKVQSISMMAVA
jgi:TolB-like protein